MKKSLNVLLADDDPKDHKQFELALQNADQPVKIQSVYNGLKLIDYLTELFDAKNLARPDLIITDLYMPFAGGLQVLKQIRKNVNFKDIPIYVFSANYDISTQKNVKEFGATGFYQKPGDQGQLQVIINEILGKHETVAV